MKNKHLALLMAVIMCFALVCGASAAATEGEQIFPSAPVSATGEPDIIDQVVEGVGEAAGDKISDVGSDIMDGIEESYGFITAFDRIVSTVKVFFANLINTIFSMFGIGGDSFFG